MRHPIGLAPDILLPIPDRQWVSYAPATGWCGESSIQMIALSLGAWLPQAFIHEIANVKHTDIWIEDVAFTLNALGLQATKIHEHVTSNAFIRQIISSLTNNHPVIVGCKVYPSDHPHANCDHIMPVVGCKGTGLYVNTNLPADVWKSVPHGQALIDDSGLLTKKPGFSFINVQGEFYGFPVQSFVDANGYPVVVQAGKEEGVMTLSVTASGLTSGTNYVLEQDDMLGSIENLPFTATGTTQTWSITADCLQVAKFTVIQDG